MGLLALVGAGEEPARGRDSFRSASRDKRIVLEHRKLSVYNRLVIRSFGDGETERFYTTGRSRRFPADVRARASRRLTQLNAATRIEDLRLPPSNRLEQLKGDRKGQWSIRINDQWRVCFQFDKGDALDVEIVDYH